MGLNDIIKAKLPSLPKEIDDKAIKDELKKWTQAYGTLQTAAEDFGGKIGQASGSFGNLTFECLKKLKDKNLDPKQKKALEELHATVSKLEGFVAKL